MIRWIIKCLTAKPCRGTVCESEASWLNGKVELKKVYLDFIDTNISSLRSYHDHKETRAWVATAFYIPIIVAFAWKIPSHPVFLLLCGTFFITVFLIIALKFVSLQFNWRMEVDNEIKGLYRARDKLVHDTSTLDKLRVHKKVASADGKINIWPSFINESIKEVNEASVPYLRDRRLHTQLISYSAIILASLIALGILFLRSLEVSFYFFYV